MLLQQALNADFGHHSLGELSSGTEAEDTSASRQDMLRSQRTALGRLAQDSKRESTRRTSIREVDATSEEKTLAQKQLNSKIMVIGNKAHLAQNRDVSPRGRPRGATNTEHGCQADSATGADSVKAPNRIEVKMVGNPAEDTSRRGTVMKVSSKASLLQPHHPEGELQLQLRLMEAALFAPDLDLQVTGSGRQFTSGLQSKASPTGPSGPSRRHRDSSPTSKAHDLTQARKPTDA